MDIDSEKYFKVIEDKTAKLFSSSAVVGGIISKCSEKNVPLFIDTKNGYMDRSREKLNIEYKDQNGSIQRIEI